MCAGISMTLSMVLSTSSFITVCQTLMKSTTGQQRSVLFLLIYLLFPNELSGDKHKKTCHHRGAVSDS